MLDEPLLVVDSALGRAAAAGAARSGGEAHQDAAPVAAPVLPELDSFAEI